MMRIISVLAALMVVVSCVDIDRDEIMRQRAKEKPAKPIEVNKQKLLDQEKELIQLFSINYVQPDYEFEKDPFYSVVEEYKQSRELEEETSNPLLLASVDEIKIRGILTGEVGNIAVASLGKDTYYLRAGDEMGLNRSRILFIGSDFIRLRDVTEDIFGNKKTEVREIQLDPYQEKEDEENGEKKS
ncbi:hypothetical protein [Limisalsivibrio acetivorans]|uniref:hypothetical protein n=1 Tax=Limisalsivibrio acetivorans TaxID=1304888 RepID=UPI0003B7A8EA|nr:hypothetical protein [Limisalsivibrio acetivorans]